jgi:transposase-like protein
MGAFPKTLLEFDERFGTEQACRDYVFRLRWPEGFRCPRCGHDKTYSTGRLQIECRRCAYQVSIIAGTIFQGSRSPLRLWFRAMWLVVSQKTGASALNLQRVLGLGGYQTAWTWLHKLRRAMVRPGRDRLDGRVEVDETFWGSPDKEARGRRAGKKALIAIAAEEDGEGIGRIRMRRIPNASAQSLERFMQESIEPGSVVHTDGWEGYGTWVDKDYRHEVTVLKGKPLGAASELLPRVHRVASLLKRWLMGTHQGAISQEHLDYYLDEFTFRFNRRSSKSRGLLFFRLLEQAVAVQPTSYRTMVKGARGKKAEVPQRVVAS